MTANVSSTMGWNESDVLVRALMVLPTIGFAPRDESVPVPTDDEIARSVFRDPERFTTLYESHYDRILGYLYRQTGNRETAEDLTAQTFLQAFEHLAGGERQIRFRPWLYRVASNVHGSHERKRRGWLARIAEAASQRERAPQRGPSDGAALESETNAARRALATLAPEYREAIELRYDEELDFDEVADILGLTPEGARTRVWRGLRMMRARMEDKR